MTLHAIGVAAESPDTVTDDDADTYMDNALSTFSQKLPSEEHEISRTGGIDPGVPEHFTARYRFDLAEDKTSILNAVEDTVANDIGSSWYEISYHECDHGEPDSTRHCNDTVERTPENNSVPDGV